MYKIRMSKESFVKNKIKGTNIKADEAVDFNVLSLNGLSDYQILVDYKKAFLNWIFNKKWFLIGMILSITFIFINSKAINDIKFNGDFIINQKIEEVINDNINKIGPFGFFNGNIKNLSVEIRCMFPDYEWIDLEKKGNDLFVYINRSDINDLPKNELIIGDIISKYDSVIHSFNVINGKSLVKNNNYVKKGDVLILGDNPINKTEAKGIVLGYIGEYKTIEVNKTNNSTIYEATKNVIKISIFGFSFNINKPKYDNYDKQIKNKKEIFNLLKIENIEYKKKRDIINIYDKQLADIYARSLIQSEFDSLVINENEKVEEIVLLDIIENDEKFYCSYFVKSLKSLGEFIRR